MKLYQKAILGAVTLFQMACSGGRPPHEQGDGVPDSSAVSSALTNTPQDALDFLDGLEKKSFGLIKDSALRQAVEDAQRGDYAALNEYQRNLGADVPSDSAIADNLVILVIQAEVSHPDLYKNIVDGDRLKLAMEALKKGDPVPFHEFIQEHGGDISRYPILIPSASLDGVNRHAGSGAPYNAPQGGQATENLSAEIIGQEGKTLEKQGVLPNWQPQTTVPKHGTDTEKFEAIERQLQGNPFLHGRSWAQEEAARKVAASDTLQQR